MPRHHQCLTHPSRLPSGTFDSDPSSEKRRGLFRQKGPKGDIRMLKSLRVIAVVAFAGSWPAAVTRRSLDSGFMSVADIITTMIPISITMIHYGSRSPSTPIGTTSCRITTAIGTAAITWHDGINYYVPQPDVTDGGARMSRPGPWRSSLAVTSTSTTWQVAWNGSRTICAWTCTTTTGIIAALRDLPRGV